MSKSSDPRKGRKIVRSSTAVRQMPADYELDYAFELFYNVKQAEGMRPRTLSDYKTHWRYFREWLDEQYPEIKLREITTAIIREYVIYMSSGRMKYEGIDNRVQPGKTLSPTTVSIRLRTLRTMFRFWTEEGLIVANPTGNIKPPRQDEEELRTFTDEQIRLLLEQPDINTYAGFRNRTLMYLLADTGLRINEALRLTMDYLDVKSRSIHLPAAMNKNRRPRIVPVSPEVMRMLFELVNENKAHFGDIEHIFLSNYGDPLKADHFRKQLREYGKMAGIDGQVRVSPHTFRHYFCKTYLLNGGDIFTLQRIVAHSSIETTRKYVSMDDENIRQQHAQYSPLQRLGRVRAGRRRNT